MSASDSPGAGAGANDPPQRPATRAFFRAMAATALTLCLTAAAFNWLMDPYGLFDNPLLPGINDIPSWRATSQRRRALSLTPLHERTRDYAAAHNVFLMGTSHVLLGMATCRHPEVLRLALSGVTQRQLLTLAEDLLSQRTSPATLLVEFSREGDDDDAAAIEPQTDMKEGVYGLFSWRTTLTSLANLRAARRHGQLRGEGPPGCFSEPPPDDFPAFTQALNRQLAWDWRLNGEDLAGVERLLDLVGRHCGPNGHRLRLFMLPVHPALSEHPVVGAHIAGNVRLLQERVARFAAQRPDCDAAFVAPNQLDPPGGAAGDASPRGWYDPTHFRQSHGERILERLLATVPP